MNTLEQRFKAKLVPADDGCLIFTGGKNRAGYGNIYTHSVGGKAYTAGAHRVAYELAFGKIPEGLFVLHHCDNPSCCNPDHLFLGTQADNMTDKAEKGRAQPGPVSRSKWWTAKRRFIHHEKLRASYADKAKAEAEAAGYDETWKRCPSCDTWKPRTMFGRNKARADGLQAQCKPCKHTADTDRRRIKAGTKSRNKTRSDKKFF